MAYNNLLLQMLGNIGKGPNIDRGDVIIDPTTNQVTVKPAQIKNKFRSILTGENQDVAALNDYYQSVQDKFNAGRVEQNAPTDNAVKLAQEQYYLKFLADRNAPDNEFSRAAFKASKEYEELNKKFLAKQTSGWESEKSESDAKTSRSTFEKTLTDAAQNQVTVKPRLVKGLVEQGIFGPIRNRGNINLAPGETLFRGDGDGVRPMAVGSTTDEQMVGKDMLGNPLFSKISSPGMSLYRDPSTIKRQPTTVPQTPADDGAATVKPTQSFTPFNQGGFSFNDIASGMPEISNLIKPSVAEAIKAGVVAQSTNAPSESLGQYMLKPKPKTAFGEPSILDFEFWNQLADSVTPNYSK